MDKPELSPDQQRLENLIDAGHPCISIVTSEETYAMERIQAAALRGGHNLLVWSASRGLRSGLFEDGEYVEKTENAAAALYHVTNHVKNAVLCVMLDLSTHLDDARTLRALREAIERFRRSTSCLVLIDHQDHLPQVIAAEAMPLAFALPDRVELEELLYRTLRRLNRDAPIDARTSRADLDAIIRNLQGLSRNQAEQIVVDCVTDDRRFCIEDIATILAHKRQRLHRDGVLEFVEAPASLDEVGGLKTLKSWLRKRRDALGEKARDFGLVPPRGVLLLGVQGAGKSLCAKAIATGWQRPLLRLDPGVLYDRYVGESEKRLRAALDQAEAMAPIILWIDEIEKGFASAASQSTDGGLSQRMFGTLLTWMQDHEAPVFLVATANNIDALPPELLRKGRFDEIFFVDLPDDAVRRLIFAIHLRKRDREPEDFDLATLAAASDGYSGSEIEQAIVSALHDAFSDDTTLSTAMILEAIEQTSPLSVTMAERVAALRRWAVDRCVPAG